MYNVESSSIFELVCKKYDVETQRVKVWSVGDLDLDILINFPKTPPRMVYLSHWYGNKTSSRSFRVIFHFYGKKWKTCFFCSTCGCGSKRLQLGSLWYCTICWDFRFFLFLVCFGNAFRRIREEMELNKNKSKNNMVTNMIYYFII